MKPGSNSFNTLTSLEIDGQAYHYLSLEKLVAKGSRLLGVNAVIAENFERIHRSNLIGMGVLPLQLIDGFERKRLNPNGVEKITISGMQQGLLPRQKPELSITDGSGQYIGSGRVVPHRYQR